MTVKMKNVFNLNLAFICCVKTTLVESRGLMDAGCVMGHHWENDVFCIYSKSILDM